MPIKFMNLPMHGEVSSSNASGGVTVSIYPIGSTSAHTQEDNEFFVVTDVIISAAAGGLVTLFCDSDGTPSTVGAGETAVSVTLPVNGVLAITLKQPFWGTVGDPLVFKAPSGQANCQVFGFIKANPNSTMYPTYPAQS